MRSVFLIGIVAFSLHCVATPALGDEQRRDFDVVIYGGTPGGIATAISVARCDRKHRVAIVTPYRRVGGMIANGLTHPDFRTFEARTGLFREFNRRVEAYFVETYGKDSRHVAESLLGHSRRPGDQLSHFQRDA